VKRLIAIGVLVLLLWSEFLCNAGFAVAAPLQADSAEAPVQLQESTQPASAQKDLQQEPAPAKSEETTPIEEKLPQKEAAPTENPEPTEEGPAQEAAPAETPQATSTEENIDQEAALTEDPSMDPSQVAAPEEAVPEEYPEAFPMDENQEDIAQEEENGVIRLDGDFSDWIDMPSYDPKDNGSHEGDLQIKWYYSQSDFKLYIMTILEKPHKNGKGKIITQIKTDFEDDGKNYQAKVDYSTEGGSDVVSVMTSVKALNWSHAGNWGRVLPDGSIWIEYAIPMEDMLNGMQWGYLIQFRLLNGSANAPSNSWITVSSANTFPFVGVSVSVLACVLLPTWAKRKKQCIF